MGRTLTASAVLSVVAAIALAAAAPAALGTGSVRSTHTAITAQSSADRLVNHFKCYRSKGGRPNVTVVKLTDEFGSGLAAVGLPTKFCNPVSKNAERIPHPDAHLTCYHIRPVGHHPAFQPRSVVVTNQFGHGHLVVKRPRSLCVPSAKSLTKRPPGHVPVDTDHFECYSAVGARPRTRPVSLADEFGSHMATVLRATRFCNPVSKNGGKILFSRLHLVCYRIEPRQDVRRVVSVRNQFGEQGLEIIRSKTLCVPSLAEQLLPDLTIAIPGNPKETCTGQPIECVTTFQFVVSNVGVAPVLGGAVFHVFLQADPNLSVTQTVTIVTPPGGLPPATSLPTQTASMPPDGSCADPDCTVQATVNPFPHLIAESNYGNNVATRTEIG